MPASHFDVKPMTGRPKLIVHHSTTSYESYTLGSFKNKIYNDKPQNLQDMEARIRHEIEEIPPHWLQNSLRNFVTDEVIIKLQGVLSVNI
jgi:hypothetical protein